MWNANEVMTVVPTGAFGGCDFIGSPTAWDRGRKPIFLPVLLEAEVDSTLIINTCLKLQESLCGGGGNRFYHWFIALASRTWEWAVSQLLASGNGKHAQIHGSKKICWSKKKKKSMLIWASPSLALGVKITWRTEAILLFCVLSLCTCLRLSERMADPYSSGKHWLYSCLLTLIFSVRCDSWLIP